MTELSSENVIARARSHLGMGQGVPVRAWRVRRIDLADRTYYLVVFGPVDAAVAVVTVDAMSGKVMTSAFLHGADPYPVVDADQAIQKAGLVGAPAELVWKPCRLSLSPLYPFWQVGSGDEALYVSQQGVVSKILEPGGPGGRA